MGARKATLVFAFAFAALVAVFQHSQGQPLQGGGPSQGQPPQNNNGADGVVAQPPQGQPLQNNNGTDGVVAQPPQGQPLQNNNGTDGVVAQPPQGQPLQINNGTDGVVAQPGSGGCTSNGPQPQGNAPANQPINVTFAPDLASRPAINFMLRLGGVALVNNESYVKQFDYDMKYVLMEYLHTFSPMIIDLGFSLDCSSFACSEVLSSKSLDGGNETAVQMHMVLPWGVPLPVAQTLAIDVGLGGKALVDGLGLPHRNGQTVTQVYGNAVAGLITAVQFTDVPEQSSLKKVLELRVAVIENVHPFMYKENSSSTSDSDWVGFLPDLLDEWESNLPPWISFKIVPIDDAHSASFVDGLVGMVTDGLADIALGPVFITSGRLRNVSFSHSWFDTGEVLVTQAPKPSSFSPGSFLSFLAPFSMDLWVTVVIVSIVAGITFWAVETKAPRREGVESDFDGEGRDGFVHGAMDYSMWLSFSTFWGALATHSPTSVLGRLLSMAYALFILVVINSYTANLASYLVVTGSLEYPIESLDQAQTEGKKVCFLEGSRAATLALHEFPTLKEVLIAENAATSNAHAAFEAALQTGFADVRNGVCDGFVIDELFAQYYLRNGNWCDLTTVGLTYFNGNYGAAMHPELPIALKNELSSAMNELRATGTINLLLGEWFSHGDQCAGPTSSFTPLYVHEMTGVITIFCIGLTAAIVAILFRAFKKPKGGDDVKPLISSSNDAPTASAGSWMKEQHQSNGEHPSQGTAESKLSDDELRVGSRVTTMPNGLEDDRSSIIDNAEARSQPSHIRMAWG